MVSCFSAWQLHKAWRRAWFGLASAEIDRWFMSKYSQNCGQVHEIHCLSAVYNLQTFWKNNYCLYLWLGVLCWTQLAVRVCFLFHAEYQSLKKPKLLTTLFLFCGCRSSMWFICCKKVLTAHLAQNSSANYAGYSDFDKNLLIKKKFNLHGKKKEIIKSVLNPNKQWRA